MGCASTKSSLLLLSDLVRNPDNLIEYSWSLLLLLSIKRTSKLSVFCESTFSEDSGAITIFEGMGFLISTLLDLLCENKTNGINETRSKTNVFIIQYLFIMFFCKDIRIHVNICYFCDFLYFVSISQHISSESPLSSKEQTLESRFKWKKCGNNHILGPRVWFFTFPRLDDLVWFSNSNVFCPLVLFVVDREVVGVNFVWCRGFPCNCQLQLTFPTLHFTREQQTSSTGNGRYLPLPAKETSIFFCWCQKKLLTLPSIIKILLSW